MPPAYTSAIVTSSPTRRIFRYAHKLMRLLHMSNSTAPHMFLHLDQRTAVRWAQSVNNRPSGDIWLNYSAKTPHGTRHGVDNRVKYFLNPILAADIILARAI